MGWDGEGMGLKWDGMERRMGTGIEWRWEEEGCKDGVRDRNEIEKGQEWRQELRWGDDGDGDQDGDKDGNGGGDRDAVTAGASTPPCPPSLAEIQDLSLRGHCIRDLVASLPPAHHDTMEVLFRHLCR